MLNEAYVKGYSEGRDNGDARNCPYQGTTLVLDWLDGFHDGWIEYQRITNG
jgi:ribosome modulation factor